MKLVCIVFLSILLVGCKNIIKDEHVVEKPTTHLVESQNDVKVITVQEIPVNVKMDAAPVSQPSTTQPSELVQKPVNVDSTASSRPEPEAQPVASQIVVSPNSAKTMIIVLALCGFGIFYFLIKNGKK